MDSKMVFVFHKDYETIRLESIRITLSGFITLHCITGTHLSPRIPTPNLISSLLYLVNNLLMAFGFVIINFCLQSYQITINGRLVSDTTLVGSHFHFSYYLFELEHYKSRRRRDSTPTCACTHAFTFTLKALRIENTFYII